MSRLILRPFAVFLTLILSVVLQLNTSAQTADPKLVELRQNLAMQYLEPAPHMELAKYYLDKGDRLQAFYLTEYARRARFPKMIFDTAFANVFGGSSVFDNSDKGEALFNKATEFQKAGRLVEAEAAFIKSAELASNSAYTQAWVGRFFYKVKKDERRALEYYLNAYFLDPDAYETEYAESRIRAINMNTAVARFRQLAVSDDPMKNILGEKNPTVVVLAAEQLNAKWRPAYLKTALELLGHDDEEVRWLSMGAIMKNADASFDVTLNQLLKDPDQRKRGLAAYIAVSRWKEKSFGIIEYMLGEKSQLLRFDALSALAMYGGEEGLQMMISHRAFEPHPKLKEMIDKSMNKTQM